MLDYARQPSTAILMCVSDSCFYSGTEAVLVMSNNSTKQNYSTPKHY